MNNKMNNFPKIETERLFLDKLKLEDVPLITKYASNRKISKYYLNIPYPITEADTLRWISHSYESFEKDGNFIFGIYLKSTQEFIGSISLVIVAIHKKAILGYWVAVSFWNKGYATEATRAIIDFGFKNLRLNKICATHSIKNDASGKVMQKAGMIKEGTFL